MKGLSKKEIEIISNLEFKKKYFFTSKDIDRFVKDTVQRNNVIRKLKAKKRIIKINRSKYYLIPIKARSGGWSEHPFIIVDEIMNGKDYYIGGWSAVNYWQLTDQIPFRIDAYTTKKPRKMNVLNTKIVFHKARKKAVDEAVTEKIGDHEFRIKSREDSKKWMKSRN